MNRLSTVLWKRLLRRQWTQLPPHTQRALEGRVIHWCFVNPAGEVMLEYWIHCQSLAWISTHPSPADLSLTLTPLTCSRLAFLPHTRQLEEIAIEGDILLAQPVMDWFTSAPDFIDYCRWLGEANAGEIKGFLTQAKHYRQQSYQQIKESVSPFVTHEKEWLASKEAWNALNGRVNHLRNRLSHVEQKMSAIMSRGTPL